MADQPQNREWRAELVGWRAPRSGRFSAATRASRGDLEDTARKVGAQIILPRLKRESPVGTHPLGVPPGYKRFADSWESTFQQTATGGVFTASNRARHAKYVLFPTKRHPIRPTHAKFLRFPGRRGGVVFSRGVMHPGTKGNKVVDRAMQAVQGQVKGELQKATGTVRQRVVDVFKD